MQQRAEESLHTLIAKNKHFTPTRKPSLYSNFRQLAEYNETGYEANVLAWRSVLDEALSEGSVFHSRVVISAGPELVKASVDGTNGVPLALDCVFESLVKSKELQPLPEFVAQHSRSSFSSILAAVWRLAVGPSKFTASERNGALRAVEYVSLPQVSQLSQNLADNMNHGIHASLSMQIATVEEIADAAECSVKDARLALLYARSKGLVAFDDNPVSVGDITSADSVKGSPASNAIAGSGIARAINPRTPISPAERMLVSVKFQIARLTQRESSLDASCSELLIKARTVIRQSAETADASKPVTSDNVNSGAVLNVDKTARQRARFLLQRRAQLEAARSSVSKSLMQLENVVTNIDSASDNSQTLDALAAGALVLRGVNASSSIENAEKVMDDVQEAIADANEIGEILTRDADADAAELDAELADIEEEVVKEKELERKRIAEKKQVEKDLAELDAKARAIESSLNSASKSESNPELAPAPEEEHSEEPVTA